MISYNDWNEKNSSKNINKQEKLQHNQIQMKNTKQTKNQRDKIRSENWKKKNTHNAKIETLTLKIKSKTHRIDPPSTSQTQFTSTASWLNEIQAIYNQNIYI